MLRVDSEGDKNSCGQQARRSERGQRRVCWAERSCMSKDTGTRGHAVVSWLRKIARVFAFMDPDVEKLWW